MNIKGQRYNGASVALERLSDNLDSDDETESLQRGGIRGADFETAVAATGYGKFNYLMLLGIFLPTWASIFDVSNISMILPSAECDLDLSLFHKGVLNASVYAGTICTAMLWGFMSDVYGRRKLLIFGFLADSLCNILSGTAQNFWVLLFFKFANGCIFNGPYAIMMCYCAEFHGGNNRARVMLFLGLFSTIGNIAVPVLAWCIIPQTWEIALFDGLFVYNSWRLFLTMSGLPTLVGFAAIIFFPESPKFLMAQGRNDEAMAIFKRMFAMNTGKSPDQYPVSSLEDENYGSEKSVPKSIAVSESGGKGNRKTVLTELCEGLKQMKPLFLMPHLPRLVLVVSIQFGGMLAYNTIRLWLPQLFTILENFSRLDHGIEFESDPTFCEMIDVSMNHTTKSVPINETMLNSGPRHCEKVIVDDSVYINIAIICIVASVGFILMSTIIHLIGKKNILFICYGVALVCGVSLNWSANTILTLFLSCLFVALTNISVNTMIAITVELFPTSLRTMSVAVIMMIGRSGSLTGNLLFPVLIKHGCLTPLMAISGLLLGCVVLALFIPKPKGGLK